MRTNRSARSTVTAALLCVPLAALAQGTSAPLVTLVYPGPEGTIFDRLCSRRLHVPIEPRQVAETVARRAEFQALWDREGPLYLDAMLKAVGAPFPYAEMQATLTVCTDVTLAMPLMINLRTFLSDAPVPEDPVMFPRLVFHEMMHTYTQPVDEHSALRRKYAAEGVHVTNHLHVLAAEKYVLTQLGRHRELSLLDKDYRGAPADDAYRRAWEIVDREGTGPFLAELREHLPRTTAADRIRSR